MMTAISSTSSGQGSPKEEPQWHLPVLSHLQRSSQSLYLSVPAAPLATRNRLRPWRARPSPIPYDATASDSNPSGAQMLLIACAAMADRARPA